MKKQKIRFSSFLFLIICGYSISVYANVNIQKEKGDPVRLKRGYFAVQNEFGMWALKSTKKGIVTEYIYDKISKPAFSSEYFLTEISGAYGMINTLGKVVHKNVCKKMLEDEIHFFSKCELRNENMQLLFSVYADSLKDIGKSKFAIWRNGKAYLSSSVNQSLIKTSIEVKHLKFIGKIDKLQNFKNIFVVTKDKKMQLFNSDFKLIHKEKFDTVKQFHSNIVATKYDNHHPKSYIFDGNGRLLNNDALNYEVKEELKHHWIVIYYGKYYLLDKRNGKLGKRGYLHLSSVDEQYFFFKLINQTGLINIEEEFIFFGRFKKIEKIGSNLFICHSKKLNGFLKKESIKVFYKTQNPLEYKDGFILEKHPNGEVRVFNQYGTPLFPYLVTDVRIYNQYKIRNYLTCKYNGYSILVDEFGRLIVSHNQKYTDILDNPSFFFIFTKNKQKGLIDTDGQLIVTNRYDNISNVSEGKIGYKLLKKWGYIDQMETLITQPKFNKISQYKSQYSAVKKGNRWGLLDAKGQWMLNPKYDQIYWNNIGGWVVKNEQYQGFIDEFGREVILPSFTNECEQLNQEFLKIKKGKIYMLFNLKKKIYEEGQWDIIQPMKYDSAWLFVYNQESQTFNNTN